MFKCGDRIKLTHPKEYYTIGLANPLVGTKFECPGTIIEIYDGNKIEVKWDNKTTNGYDEEDLDLYYENTISIW